MSQATTHIINMELMDDYVSPTTDVWQTDIDQLQTGSHMTMRDSTFRGWAVPVIESVNVFEDAEINARAPKTIFVTLSSPERPSRSLVYTTFAGPALLYVPMEECLESSRRQIDFSPDFFNIKKFAAYVMGRATVSRPEQEEAFETQQKIPITIHPEVIREAEEKNHIYDLETSIKLAQETYVALKRIRVNIEHDPEIVERKTIRLTLTVSSDPETVLKNEYLFKRRLRSNITPRGRALITVTYDREE